MAIIGQAHSIAAGTGAGCPYGISLPLAVTGVTNDTDFSLFREATAGCNDVTAVPPERRRDTMTSPSMPRTGTHQVTGVDALEILDSRGRPTLQVTVAFGDGTTATAGVPSGASTGSGEAVERRDGDKTRYQGLGVLGAVDAARGEITGRLRGQEWHDLAGIDAALIELDGTPNKGRLGANAIVGVSMACARGLARADGRELWLSPPGVAPRLPVPHFNVINGGVHAPNPLDFQEFMIAPLGAGSLPEAVRAGAEVYGELRSLLASQGHATGLGDEGGFAPQLAEPEEVLALLVTAIDEAGYAAGRDGVRSRWTRPPASSTATTACTRWPGRS
jgi:enolase